MSFINYFTSSICILRNVWISVLAIAIVAGLAGCSNTRPQKSPLESRELPVDTQVADVLPADAAVAYLRRVHIKGTYP